MWVPYRASVFVFGKNEYDDWTGADVDGAIDLWWRWKTFGGLPFAGGWAEQPAYIVEVLESCEVAYKTVQAHEAKRKSEIERGKAATRRGR